MVCCSLGRNGGGQIVQPKGKQLEHDVLIVRCRAVVELWRFMNQDRDIVRVPEFSSVRGAHCPRDEHVDWMWCLKESGETVDVDHGTTSVEVRSGIKHVCVALIVSVSLSISSSIIIEMQEW